MAVGFEPAMTNVENLNNAAYALTHELLLLLVNHIPMPSLTS